MKSDFSDKAKKEHPDGFSTGEVPKQKGKEANVPYGSKPFTSSPDNKIHERNEIPPLPEGEEHDDETPSPPVELD